MPRGAFLSFSFFLFKFATGFPNLVSGIKFASGLDFGGLSPLLCSLAGPKSMNDILIFFFSVFKVQFEGSKI